MSQATGLPGWASLGDKNLPKVKLPDRVEEVVIAQDGDPAGERAAQLARQHFRLLGRSVRLLKPPPGLDFNDVLMGVASSTDGAKIIKLSLRRAEVTKPATAENLQGSLEDSVLTALCCSKLAKELAPRITANSFSTPWYSAIAAKALDHMANYGEAPGAHLWELLKSEIKRGEYGSDIRLP